MRHSRAARLAVTAQTVPATGTRVVDGDTVGAEDAHGPKLRIRLVGIDAPEVGHPRKQGGSTPGQPWGDEARRVLADLALKQPVELEVYGRDRYKCILAVVRHGTTNVNELLVRSGLAWYYRGGRNDAPAALKRQREAGEADARQAQRGFWADPNPEPPWAFRRWLRLER